MVFAKTNNRSAGQMHENLHSFQNPCIHFLMYAFKGFV